jgi:aldehyde dehydrogenase (NAD+)
MTETTEHTTSPNGHAGAGAATRAPIRWDYSPAPESTDHVRLRDRYGLFIGGEFVEADAYAPTINPATEEPLAEIAQASAADVARAVESARAAAPAWARLSGLERGKYVFRIARLIQERARELAVVETLDGGKPIKESRDVDVPLAAAHFFYYAGWADKLEYGVPVGVGRRAVPRGVVGQVIPWNFPLLMAAWKLAPALATGNTAVLKPADTTPLTALLLAEILQEAELPDGVVNIVPGDGSAGAALVRGAVDKVAFTGSTAVGRDIQAALAGRDVGLTLELGGKSANIVFEDAALDQAVEGIVQGIFFNQGHVCCAGSRLLVQESVAEQVIEKLWSRMQNLRVGDPLDKNTDVGAINSRAQLDRIEELVAVGVEEGAGLRQVACSLPERGFWFSPAIFTEASPAHRISREEIFGPVLSITTFRTHAEAIEKANNSAYGLAAGIWTDKGSKAFQVTNALRSGVVWQNTYNHFDPTAAFGGFKESGFGREGGPAGLRPYVKVEAAS